MVYTEGHKGAQSAIKKMQKSDQIPTSMSCRNSPSAGKMLKPEVTFKAAPNKEKRAWTVFAYFGQMEWKPGKPGVKNAWTKRYSTHFGAPGSGREFHCSLWYGPKGSLGKLKRNGSNARSQ
ncbi:hypothetical protein C0081_09965 [Cohaesibacter celericrescens]|uniref:Uncharacterized protein n=2 Tax=Cohaesibacter celericrescens TaxID=2067669 RepID=A0A2N5XSX9_9HYPH|nr:hypothetical protein C0081_09965 [Cohaesibacter celericrescens]